MKIELDIIKFKESLFDLPYFVFRKKQVNDNLLLKIIFFLRAHFIIFSLKKFNKTIFTNVMNLFYKSDGKIAYNSKNNLYYKCHKNSKIYFPNKYRILGSMVNHQYEMINLLNSYCLSGMDLDNDDLIVDCGANIGGFYLALEMMGVKPNYIGFEPDKNVIECLKLNLKNKKNIKVYQNTLGPKDKTEKLYLKSNFGDSTLQEIESEEVIDVETIALDSLYLNNIKLFKIDAEGSELEVLKGSLRTLQNTEYVSVDMGSEKGKNSQNTVSEVTNFLIKNKFELFKFNPERTVGLFKNNNLNSSL